MRKRALSAFFMAAVMSAAAVFSAGCSSEKKEDNTAEMRVKSGDTLAEITLKIGDETGKIRIKLFPEIAPEGVDNFVKLAESGYYEGKSIHRVVENFMMQGGALRSDGVGGTTASKTDVPRETNERMRAYYGAVGFAENAEGINSQFFIINNKTPFDIDKTAEKLKSDLEEYSERLKEEDKKYYEGLLERYTKCPDEVKAKYLSDGGVFDIDGEYTIFGQTIEGFDVIDKIAKIEVSSGNKIDDAQNIPSKPVTSIIIKKIEIARIPFIEETAATTTQKPVRTLASEPETTPQSAESAPESAESKESTESAESAPESVENTETTE